MSDELRPAAFLDRDGVLNHRIPGDTYVTCPAELEILPYVSEAARRLASAGYALVVVTNQRGVARGFMDEVALEAVHDKLRAHFAAAGAPRDPGAPRVAAVAAAAVAAAVATSVRGPQPVRWHDR